MAGEKPEKQTEYTVTDKAFEEGQKLLFATFKHLTALSTGAILLLATFIKDLFKAPEWSFLVSVTFGLLILSTIASVFTMMALSHSVQKSGRPSVTATNFGAAVMLVSIGGFLLGIIALAAFALKNFQ